MKQIPGAPGERHEYVLGHSEAEIDRLQTQARIIDPTTERIFRAAGIREGMRVLDVGSGVGDVAFLIAKLVGASGTVVGADLAEPGIQVARTRAASLSIKNVEFHVGDPTSMAFDEPFDAVAGRYVLQFQTKPAEMLQKLAGLLKQGGIIAFHEIDWAGLASFPPSALFDQCCQLGIATLRAHGTETRMGFRLHATFVDAGLPAPQMRLEALLGGEKNSFDVLRLISSLMKTLMPEMERLGIATPSDIGIEDLYERLKRDAEASKSLFVGNFQVGAWANIK